MCRGNRVRRLPMQRPGFEAHWPHQKTARSHATTSFTFPADLTPLMTLYFQRAYPVLSAAIPSTSTSTPHPFMLMDSRGGAFTGLSFPGYFERLLQSKGLPVIPPRHLRHTFVDAFERRGASDDQRAGAAHVMGNSPKEWRRSYDVGRGQRHAQEVVEGLAGMREALLATPGSPSPCAGATPSPSPPRAHTPAPGELGDAEEAEEQEEEEGGGNDVDGNDDDGNDGGDGDDGDSDELELVLA